MNSLRRSRSSFGKSSSRNCHSHLTQLNPFFVSWMLISLVSGKLVTFKIPFQSCLALVLPFSLPDVQLCAGFPSSKMKWLSPLYSSSRSGEWLSG